MRNRQDWTKPRIDTFESHTEIDDVCFTWDEIDAIKAYKIDLVITDEIRLLISFGSSEKLLELSEEQEGFETFIRIAERKLFFPEKWWDCLVKPAFEKSETALFGGPHSVERLPLGTRRMTLFH